MGTTERIAGVLIVGAGYAGLHAARGARASGAPVTIVDRDGVHGFTTRLAAVAGGTAGPGDAFAPLDKLCDSVRHERVVAIDDGVVRTEDGSVLAADAVVITAGARPVIPDVTGIELAMSLRTPADALRLREAIESAEALSIVGGGPTGIQLAGAAAVARPDLTIRVIDREPVFLAGMDRSLGDHALGVLEERGVEVRLERELDAVHTGGLTLSDGTLLDGLVVWAGGFESVADELGDDLPLDAQRLRVGRDLRVDGWTRTFAAGDVAAHRDRNGELLAMSAQIAVQAGQQAGRNAGRIARGRETEPASFSHRGWVVDLGGGRGVAQLGPISLASPGLDRLAPILHLGIDIKHLLEIGGARALQFAPGRHNPPTRAIENLRDSAHRVEIDRPV